MSDLRGNPYAELLDSYADPRNSLEAHATLALAFEQRTANLIALWSNPGCSTLGSTGNAVTWGIGEELVGKLLQEIQQRLGVDK